MRTVCLLLAMLTAGQAGAERWHMLDDSEFLFESSWEDTPLPGRFNEFDVRLDAETEDLTNATLTVTVDLAGADMDDPDMNEAIAGDEWFAIATYPQAIYTSESIVESAPGEYVASGELDLKGIQRPVIVPFTWSVSDDRAEMSGELTVLRTQFDIGSGEWANDESIGADVRLTFRVLLTRR